MPNSSYSLDIYSTELLTALMKSNSGGLIEWIRRVDGEGMKSRKWKNAGLRGLPPLPVPATLSVLSLQKTREFSFNPLLIR